MTFADRREAGRVLAEKLLPWADNPDVLVLALPRGGVPVGYEVACCLNAPLDLMLVRKLGSPFNPELAIGAIALPDVCVLNRDVIRQCAVSDVQMEAVLAAEEEELLKRNRLYRRSVPMPSLFDKTVILVDDGMATGADMDAAVRAVRQLDAAHVVVAVPVSSAEAFARLKPLVDDLVCPNVNPLFLSVGQAYGDFSPTLTDEVVSLLDEARKRQTAWS